MSTEGVPSVFFSTALRVVSVQDVTQQKAWRLRQTDSAKRLATTFFVNSTETSLSDPDPQASLPGIASVRNVVMTSRKEKKMKRKAASHTHRSIQKREMLHFGIVQSRVSETTATTVLHTFHGSDLRAAPPPIGNSLCPLPVGRYSFLNQELVRRLHASKG